MLLCTNASAHKELVTGAVAGSIVGCLGVVIIVVLVILWRRRFQDLPPLQFGFFHKVEREHVEQPPLYPGTGAENSKFKEPVIV
jgi:hypothetical protein